MLSQKSASIQLQLKLYEGNVVMATEVQIGV